MIIHCRQLYHYLNTLHGPKNPNHAYGSNMASWPTVCRFWTRINISDSQQSAFSLARLISLSLPARIDSFSDAVTLADTLRVSMGDIGE